MTKRFSYLSPSAHVRLMSSVGPAGILCLNIFLNTIILSSFEVSSFCSSLRGLEWLFETKEGGRVSSADIFVGVSQAVKGAS